MPEKIVLTVAVGHARPATPEDPVEYVDIHGISPLESLAIRLSVEKKELQGFFNTGDRLQLTITKLPAGS